MTSGLLKNLNEQQHLAVTAPLGPVLVLAGAGSGKTRVLTHRVAYLLKEKIFKPEEVLALTFTNKAAGEMRERVNNLIKVKGDLTRQLPITMGTFHSVCARFLREDIEKLGIGFTRNFVIYDTTDTGHMLKQIVLELGLDEQFRHQVFGYYISAAKNQLKLPGDLGVDNEFFLEKLETVYDRYEKGLREANALDFDDLLLLTCQLFSKKSKVLSKYQKRFRYVLVDEYQDTNHAQYVLLKQLVEKSKNLFVVGDDSQSIYGFRGANLQNILDFQVDYPSAKLFKLERNYRSTQSILDAAHQVIKLNPVRFEKKLWTENGLGEKIGLFEAENDTEEGEFVLRRLARGQAILEPEDGYGSDYSQETPILDRFIKLAKKRQAFRPRVILSEIPDDLSETVILYRTHAQSRAFEETMLASGIPYQIIGGIKFYERKEVKDLLAYLRLVLNPRDLVSLQRAVNMPARGIGAKSFKQILLGLGKYKYDIVRLSRNLSGLGLGKRAEEGALVFFGLLERAMKLQKQDTVLDLLELLAVSSGYKEMLLAEGREGEVRWENIEELYNVAGKYQRLPWREGMEAMLEEVALMSDLDTKDEGGNRLTMMTLHSAKGLEFDRVFFVGLEEGLLPHSRSLANPSELQEEIRLAYVGMTRARKELYLSYALQRRYFGEFKQSTPSRILKAIPKKLLRKL